MTNNSTVEKAWTKALNVRPQCVSPVPAARSFRTWRTKRTNRRSRYSHTDCTLPLTKTQECSRIGCWLDGNSTIPCSDRWNNVLRGDLIRSCAESSSNCDSSTEVAGAVVHVICFLSFGFLIPVLLFYTWPPTPTPSLQSKFQDPSSYAVTCPPRSICRISQRLNQHVYYNSHLRSCVLEELPAPRNNARKFVQQEIRKDGHGLGGAT